MIAQVGYVAVLIATVSALVITVRALLLHREGVGGALKLPVLVFLGSSVASFLLLEVAILSHDFSIAYVANNTSTTTPFIFLFATGWAALEGSILLWGLLLAVFTYLLWRGVGESDGLGVLALGVIGAVSIFWFGLMATVANPFALCVEVSSGICTDSSWWPFVTPEVPLNGLGSNPLLQNHILMAIHPPLLYIGYVGFTVPFSYAIAALWRRESGLGWLECTHRWTLSSWVFLASGILVGGWWSYEVLGWGGYWAWDPVENAALLPWLCATAFVHSAVVQRRRGVLQAWNFILVLATFSLTILGTFLTRSGVIASVHAFSQSTVGPLLLGFLGLIVFGSLTLFALRADVVAQRQVDYSFSSREGYILANNLVLTVFAFTVLFGTMYPLIVKAFSGDEIAVGRPFFDRAAVPLAFMLLLVMGVGSVSPWRRATPGLLWRRLRVATASGFVGGAVAVVIGVDSLAVIITVVLGVFVIIAIKVRYLELAFERPEGITTASVKVFKNDLGYWGGQLAHVGLALIAIAIATTSSLAVRDTVSLSVGESAVVGSYCVMYSGPFRESDANRATNGVEVTIMDETCGDVYSTLTPRINTYTGSSQPISTPDVWTGFVDDVYVGIAGGSSDQIELNVFIFPLQWLLWFGGFMMVAGGVTALGRRSVGRRRGVTGVSVNSGTTVMTHVSDVSGVDEGEWGTDV